MTTPDPNEATTGEAETYEHPDFPGVIVLPLAALTLHGPKILRSQRLDGISPDAWLLVIHPEHSKRDLAILESQFPALRAELEGKPIRADKVSFQEDAKQEGEHLEVAASWKRCPAKEKHNEQ